VVLHDAAELAAPLVAASLGIPSVSHGFGEIVPEPGVRVAGEVLAPRWRAERLEPDAHAGSYRGLYVDIYPPSLRRSDMDHVPRVQPCRPADAAPSTGGAVYVTFGTLFNEADDALRTAVLAAADVADEVVVTLGGGRDPAMLGAVPDHVRVENFIPQAEVLPHCGAVVCHGGSGTILAALAHGLPVVCIPQGADQFANAANVERVGAGRTLATDASRATLADAIEHVLHAPGPRRAAADLAGEIAAMPDHTAVARGIEAFVSG
jgi:UDP:flavonoid glycosyltransferase YjiC (YdhE family)